MQDSFNWDDNTAINIRTYARALHEREEKCQKAPTYGVLKVDLRKSCESKNWAGVDFDDESDMNADNLVATMHLLGNRERSYTFIAGWNYNSPDQSSAGRTINEKVKMIASLNVCDRFVLMCYGNEMWSMPDIKANVPQASRADL